LWVRPGAYHNVEHLKGASYGLLSLISGIKAILQYLLEEHVFEFAFIVEAAAGKVYKV
jgi:hypothetical protein